MSRADSVCGINFRVTEYADSGTSVHVCAVPANPPNACDERRSTRQVSPGQIRISVLQLCILITVPQLTLHATIATLVLGVLLCCALAPILISRFVHGYFLPSLNSGTLNTTRG